MNKVKLLGIIAFLLLLSNTFLLFLFFEKRPPRPEGPKKEIIKMLHFDTAQIAAYELLIQKHQADLKRVEQDIFKLKSAFYAQLNNERSLQKDSLLLLLGDKEMQIEQINFQHFEDIKHLCEPSQMVYFQEFSQKITRLFDHKARKPKQKR